MYTIVKSRPVARFYYQGNHTHPVRRTVLLIESTSQFIRGYEIREGATVRNFAEAPVKSYRRDRIAPSTPYERRYKLSARKLKGPCTLEREGILDLVVKGA